MTAWIIQRLTFQCWPVNFPETTHDPDVDAAQNQPGPAIYRFPLAAYGHCRLFQSWSSPYSPHSTPHRPCCAVAMAIGLPVRTVASNNTNTDSRRLQQAMRQFA